MLSNDPCLGRALRDVQVLLETLNNDSPDSDYMADIAMQVITHDPHRAGHLITALLAYANHHKMQDWLKDELGLGPHARSWANPSMN